MSKRKTGRQFIFIGSDDTSHLAQFDKGFTINKIYNQLIRIEKDYMKKGILRLEDENGKAIYIDKKKFKSYDKTINSK